MKIPRRQKQPDGSYKKVEFSYLSVQWRVVWFRECEPEGLIVTELLSTPGVSPAVVKATVTLENGVVSTGFGQCGAEDWGDWLEKAETRSIGRALALIGYGTQFCEDFDDVIADAPSDRPEQQPRQQKQRQSQRRPNVDQETGGIPDDQPQARSSGGDSPMTPNQRRYIESLARDTGMNSSGLDAASIQRVGKPLDYLSKAEASSFIEALQAVKDEQSIEGFAN